VSDAPGSPETVVELRDVRRHYAMGDQVVRALDGIDFKVERGSYWAIMGPSGSGKSTLLNVVGCLDRPTAGRYVLDGREVSGLDDAELTTVRRHVIGFVFQSFHLVPRLTALENVELPMVFAGVPRAERRERAAAGIADVGLTGRADHRPEQLSGGERQRVAIARAMIMRPRLLLADEPTGNLDSRSGQQVLELLDGLHASGLTLVVVTHDPNVGRRAERVIAMVDGRIARRLAPGELATAGGAP
jgi:putative ABC transport system ATP-binding protein